MTFIFLFLTLLCIDAFDSYSLGVTVKTIGGQTLAYGLRWAHYLFCWNTVMFICFNSL